MQEEAGSCLHCYRKVLAALTFLLPVSSPASRETFPSSSCSRMSLPCSLPLPTWVFAPGKGSAISWQRSFPSVGVVPDASLPPSSHQCGRRALPSCSIVLDLALRLTLAVVFQTGLPIITPTYLHSLFLRAQHVRLPVRVNVEKQVDLNWLQSATTMQCQK